MLESVEKRCVVINNMDLLAKKWALHILIEFWKKPKQNLKFSYFSKAFPSITSRVVSMRLKELCEIGVIRKEVVNKSIKYVLTDHGYELLTIYNGCWQWSVDGADTEKYTTNCAKV